MNQVPAPKQTAERVERLLRSLVGVADLRPAWDRSGRLCQVHILKDDEVQHHQLTRNVISALQAGFGIRLDPLNVSVYGETPLFAAAVVRIRSYDGAEAAVVPAFAAGAGVGTGSETAAAGAGVELGDGTGAASAGVQAGNGNGSGCGVAGAGVRAGNGSGSGAAGTAVRAGNGNGSGSGAAGVDVWSGVGTGSEAVLSTVAAASTTCVPTAPRPSGAAAAGVPTPVLLASPSNGDGHAHPRNGNGNGRSAAADAALATAPARHVYEPVSAAEPATETMTLERLDVERHSGALRCHVVLLLGAHRYSAIAEVRDGPAVEAELAATVTLDALRAGALTCARLEGIGFTAIGDTTYLVAAVRDASGTAKRASAAPLAGNMARAAAHAVLSAVGPITASR
jgi:hypothetical protein